jgi:hypothetical protein
VSLGSIVAYQPMMLRPSSCPRGQGFQLKGVTGYLLSEIGSIKTKPYTML